MIGQGDHYREDPVGADKPFLLNWSCHRFPLLADRREF
jgi:hypothetical protein